MMFLTVRSLLALHALLVGCIHAFSSLQATRHIVRHQVRQPFTILLSSFADDQQYKSPGLVQQSYIDSIIPNLEEGSSNDDGQSWFDQQVKQQQQESHNSVSQPVVASSSRQQSNTDLADDQQYKSPGLVQQSYIDSMIDDLKLEEGSSNDDEQSWFDQQVQQQQQENGNIFSKPVAASSSTQKSTSSSSPSPVKNWWKSITTAVAPVKDAASSSTTEHTVIPQWDDQPVQFQQEDTEASSIRNWYDEEVEQQQELAMASSSNWYDQEAQDQQQQETEVASVNEWSAQAVRQQRQEVEVTSSIATKDSFIAYIQSAFVGAVVGTVAVLPVTAYHYFTFADFTYTTYAQLEWDLIAAVIQGALFSTIYRYGLRDDVEDTNLQSRFLWAFVIVKSLVRVEVPAECAAGYSNNGFPLYCAEQFSFASDSIVSTLGINFAESLALFGATAAVMNVLLKGEWIRRYP